VSLIDVDHLDIVATGPTTLTVDWLEYVYVLGVLVTVGGEPVTLYSAEAWIYVDGQEMDHTSDNEALLPFAANYVMALEGHEQASDPIYEEPELHPLVQWRPVALAVSYKVYLTEPGEAEVVVYEEAAGDEQLLYQARCPTQCAEGWQEFRVEAVTADGIESTVDAWPHMVMNKGELPADLAISGSGGTFTLTVTP